MKSVGKMYEKCIKEVFQLKYRSLQEIMKQGVME